VSGTLKGLDMTSLPLNVSTVALRRLRVRATQTQKKGEP